ncbi:MAG: ECF transporter S component [Eubacteriales bacterium]
MKNNTLKITYAGVLIAISILLPMVFHTMGGSSSGSVFLPMHIPVLLGGFILGPIYGLVIGILAPLINALTTGMPSMVRLPFMIIELGIYGLCTGLLYHKVGLKKKKYGVYVTLISAMILGRIVYAMMLYLLIDLLGVPLNNTVTILAASITGIYGIIIQIVLIPLVLYLLKKGGLLDGLSKGSH